eukprot:gnl/MRDRNA2_/MRDRNA2_59894_c0_seq1.p1 gnl/MRDRNA2_/MRDRNA2_59894_c0~~gnl/MRDRNA2_/MRDRNA2_59894_c0_seq1.p1  ORF type:complete len:344 (+),score=55.56 gnl/MRDRNA2_/MRDRNA2_59894_c0_seq1:96-1127(+)
MTESGGKFVNCLHDAVNGDRVSHAVTAALILGNKSPSSTTSTRTSTPSGSKPPSPASSSRASTPRSSKSSSGQVSISSEGKSLSLPICSRTITPRSSRNSCAGMPPSVALRSVTKVERCQCCDIDEFWRVYESFCLMDKQGLGSVRRCDFWEAFTDHVTKDMQCTIARAKLQQRFRATAADLTFEELIERMWPAATESDHKMMNHWARLRDASMIISSPSFRGSRQNMKQVFDLLDAEGSEMLSLSELVRARILTKEELKKLLQDFHEMFGGRKDIQALSFSEFKVITQKHFLEKHAQDSWADPCRSAFKDSKKSANLGPSVNIEKVLSRRSTLNQSPVAMAC